MSEQVDHPDHYGGDTPYEVIKVLEAWGLADNAYRFNAIKYLSRAGKKGDLATDLKKAIWYVERELAALDVEEPRVFSPDYTPRVIGTAEVTWKDGPHAN